MTNIETAAHNIHATIRGGPSPLAALDDSDARAAYARLARRLGREGALTRGDAALHERRARVTTDPAGACRRLAAQHGVAVA